MSTRTIRTADGVQRAKALFSVAAGWNGEAPASFGVPEVEPVLQNPALPNGCEAASLATLLRWAGVEADPVELALEWIPRQEFSYSGSDRFGPDPDEAYAGDATSASGGWYCFSAPVVQGANNYLAFIGSSLRAEDITGAGFARLETLLADGRPVAVWFTQDYQPPASAKSSPGRCPPANNTPPMPIFTVWCWPGWRAATACWRTPLPAAPGWTRTPLSVSTPPWAAGRWWCAEARKEEPE